MISKSLRGIATALLIGTAAVSAISLSAVGVAEAAGVRPEVGKPLQEAIGLAKDGKGSAALAKVKQAENVSNLTAAEKQTIAQTREYVSAKTGNFSGGVTNATTAKAKFAADYNAGRYRDVVSTDAELLKKYGSLDFQSQLIVAQAYYLLRDYSSALRYLNGLGDGDTVLSLKLNIASRLGDARTQSEVAERLVLKGQPRYWPYLLSAAGNTPGLTDPQRFDIYRIRLLTGQMRNAGDYSDATQLAILLDLPREGLAIQQKGFDGKLLSGERQQRLLDQAKKLTAAQAAQLPAFVKQAQAAKTGDALVKLGGIYRSMGRYDDAIGTIEAGIAKGVKDPDDAQIRLGLAYLDAKKTSQAMHAFNSVKSDAKAKMDARLWSVYVRSH